MISLLQAGKPVVIQTLVAQLAIETFDVGVLRRLARLNQLHLHVAHRCPLIECFAGELGSLVGADRQGIAAKQRNTIENSRYLGTTDGADTLPQPMPTACNRRLR